MKITFSYKTDIGNYRKNNEDNVLVLKSETGEVIAAVCDGLGGHECGEIASKIAIDTIEFNFKNAQWSFFKNEEEINYWLKKLIDKIVFNMQRYVTATKIGDNMGTTLVLLLIKDNQGYIMNIGDSRAYVFKNNSLTQITVDHNILNQLIKDKKDTNFDNKYLSILTSAISPYKKIKSDIFKVLIKPKNYFLLTSDGVHNYLESKEIIKILKQKKDLDFKIDNLFAEALNNNSNDNLTSILIKVEN